MATAYRILERKRAGAVLDDAEIQAMVRGATDGSWCDSQLGAFLMAAVLQGLDERETRALTLAMLQSGECWDLGSEIPCLGDKHSTGGLGDKVSLILAPLLAACGRPVAMLTGRGLGHTGGTADKLEGIPGFRLEFDRASFVRLLREVGVAIGIATPSIAPADRKLYALRDVTATVDSLPLIAASILSKKLAMGASAVVFDVKTGSGAFLRRLDESHRLARLLVDTSTGLGVPASALITDMSQPLGRWVGNNCELEEVWACLAGEGPEDLMEVTYQLCEEMAALVGRPVEREELQRAIASGAAREQLERWILAQGADPDWVRSPSFPLAPEEVSITAPRSGVLAVVETREIGMVLIAAGAGREHPESVIDHGVALCCHVRLGQRVEAGQELARVYLRRVDAEVARRLQSCFEIADEGVAPPLVRAKILVEHSVESGVSML